MNAPKCKNNNEIHRENEYIDKANVIESCTEKGLLFLFHFTLPYKSLVPNKKAFFTFERSATFIMTFKHVFPSLPVSWGIKTCSLGTHKVNYPFTL